MTPRPKGKPGRPRKPHTTVAYTRLPIEVYDLYCQMAAAGGHRNVSDVLREVLTMHARASIFVRKTLRPEAAR